MFFFNALLIILLSLSFSCSSLPEHKNLTIIAHRGSPGTIPEHSLAGLAYAHAFSPDYIEADVVLTKDKKLIVLHDIYLDTTTNIAQIFPERARQDGRYYAADFTLEEVQKLQIKERFSPKSGHRVFPERYPEGETGLRVPSYGQFIKMLKHLNQKFEKDIGLYVEIKKPEFHLNESMDITKKLVEAHKDLLGPKSNTIIQCFWPAPLIRLKEEFQTQSLLVQLIAENKWEESSADYESMLTEEGLRKVRSYANGVGLWLERATPQLVEKIQDQDLFVHAYTHRIKNSSRKEIIWLGLNGVFTDHVKLFAPKN